MTVHTSPWTGLACIRADEHNPAAPTGHISVASAYSSQGIEPESVEGGD